MARARRVFLVRLRRRVFLVASGRPGRRWVPLFQTGVGEWVVRPHPPPPTPSRVWGGWVGEGRGSGAARCARRRPTSPRKLPPAQRLPWAAAGQRRRRRAGLPQANGEAEFDYNLIIISHSCYNFVHKIEYKQLLCRESYLSSILILGYHSYHTNYYLSNF